MSRSDALLQWLHEGRTLAGQLTPTKPGRTAWIGIYVLEPEHPETKPILRRHKLSILPGITTPVYRIRLFEIDDALRETWFAEPDMENKRDYIVIGDEALLAKLSELAVPLECLDSPWLVDYPL